MSADVDAFVALTQKYVDVPELTPTIVNELSKKSRCLHRTNQWQACTEGKNLFQLRG